MDSEKLIKYPRTYHLPFSEGASDEDKLWNYNEVISNFENKEVVVTVKMDGENSSIYSNNYTHARSLDNSYHPSRSWLKNYASSFSYKIPKNWRVCGENLYAFHSIFYTDLPSYFLAFGVYDHDNFCISWDETVEFCEFLNVNLVPVIYRGIWDEKLIRNLWDGWRDNSCFPTYTNSGDKIRRKFPEDFQPCTGEGYVVRLCDKFHYNVFNKSVAKVVRKGHVQSSEHWMQMNVIPNLLRENEPT